jgi:uncharacterized protein (UPF0332 family)
MAVQAEHFLRFAEGLLNKAAQTEIDHRNAAARAYYALLHLIRPALGLTSDASHELVRDALRALHTTAAPPYLREAKLHWRHLWEARIRSDYHLDASVTKATAEAAAAITRKIFDMQAQWFARR